MTEKVFSDFILNYERRGSYFYTLVSGPRDNFDIAIRFWKKIYLKTTELGIHKVLLEVNFPNNLTTLEMFQVAENISRIFKGRFKIAKVDKNLLHMSLNKFGETVAVNRGLQFRVFNNIIDGEKWLSKNPK